MFSSLTPNLTFIRINFTRLTLAIHKAIISIKQTHKSILNIPGDERKGKMKANIEEA